MTGPLAVLTVLYVMTALVPVLVQRREGRVQFFRPDLFIAFTSALYVVPVLVDAIWFQEWVGYRYGVEQATVLKGLLLSMGFLVAFLGGYYASVSGIRPRPSNEGEGNRLLRGNPPAWMTLGLAIAGFGLFLIFIHLEFGGVMRYVFESNRHDRFSKAVGKGYLTIGIYIGHCGIVYYYAVALVRALEKGGRQVLRINLYTALFLLTYGAFFFLTGDRRQPVFLALSLACVYFFLSRKEIGKWVAAGIPGLLVLQVFSKVRGLAAEPVKMFEYVLNNFDWKWLNLSTGELGGQFLVLGKVIEEVDPFTLNNTYLTALEHLIPSAFIGERTLSPIGWFAQTFFPNVYRVGGSLGFSSVAEAYLNFGIVGPVLVGVLFGVLMRWYYVRFVVGKNSLQLLVIYALSVPQLFLFPRTDAASFIKVLIFAVLLPMGLLWLVHQLYRTAARAGAPRWRPAAGRRPPLRSHQSS